MKKAINITIGNCVFYIEDDAYDALHSYLESIKKYMSTLPDSGEIMEDMEARIAEHFLKRTSDSSNKIISKKDVENLITVMGKVEDFAEKDENPQSREKS